MVKSRSEKEKEILQFVETNSRGENWISLTREELVGRFEDSEFDKKLIENILKGLEEEERIVLKEISFEFYCTKKLSGEVDRKLASHLTSEKNLLGILSFFVWAILLTNDHVFNLVLNIISNIVFTDEAGNVATNYSLLVSGFLVSLICILIIRNVALYLYNLIKGKFPVIKDYLWMVYPYMIFLVLGILVNYFGKISMDVAWGTTVAGGSAVTGIIYYIRRDKK